MLFILARLIFINNIHNLNIYFFSKKLIKNDSVAGAVSINTDARVNATSTTDSSTSDEEIQVKVKSIQPTNVKKIFIEKLFDPRLVTRMLYLRRQYLIYALAKRKNEYIFDTTPSPLSTCLTYKHEARYFVKLYDAYTYHPYLFTGYWDSTKNTNLKKGIVTKRFGTRFITRFISHGKKERFLHAHGVAVAYLFLSYKNTYYPIDFLLRREVFSCYLSKKYVVFNKSEDLSGDPLHAAQRRFVRRFIRLKPFYKAIPWLYDSRISIENTELAQKNMSDFAPTHAYVTTRMDKRIYKATRGKLGRYVTQIKKLHHSRALPYMYSQLKFQYSVSNKATYVDRLIDVLQCAYFIPEQTFGYMSGEAASWEI